MCELCVDRGNDLTDVSIVRRMPNIQTLSLRQVFSNYIIWCILPASLTISGVLVEGAAAS